MIGNIYYVDESEHPSYPAASVVPISVPVPKGQVIQMDSVPVTFVSLGIIEYYDNNDLIEKSKHVLKELNI